MCQLVWVYTGPTYHKVLDDAPVGLDLHWYHIIVSYLEGGVQACVDIHVCRLVWIYTDRMYLKLIHICAGRSRKKFWKQAGLGLRCHKTVLHLEGNGITLLPYATRKPMCRLVICHKAVFYLIVDAWACLSLRLSHKPYGSVLFGGRCIGLSVLCQRSFSIWKAMRWLV